MLLMHLDGQIVIDHTASATWDWQCAATETRNSRGPGRRERRGYILFESLRLCELISHIHLIAFNVHSDSPLCLNSPQGQAQPLPHADAPWPWPMPLFALGIIYQATSMVIRLVLPNGTIRGRRAPGPGPHPLHTRGSRECTLRRCRSASGLGWLQASIFERFSKLVPVPANKIC